MPKPLDHPPGPIGWPVFGVRFEFRKAPLDYLLALTREYGDVCYFRLGLKRVYLLNRPDLIEEVLVTNQGNYGPSDLFPTGGAGVAPALADRMFSDWTGGATIDVYAEMLRAVRAEGLAAALSWAWYLLAQNPTVEERMRDEVARVLSGRCPSPNDVDVLEYTDRVFAEALRLYPPGWAIARTAKNTTRLFNFVVRRGSVVLMSPYVTHRNPRLWPEPERFDPDRFLPEEIARRPRYAYLPFGNGAGDRLTWTLGVLVLAMIAQRWRLRLAADQEVAVEAARVLRPRGGLRMVIERV
jgi:cytochrome P450